MRIESSKTLLAFYVAYYEWLQELPNDDAIEFRLDWGLCSNFLRHYRANGGDKGWVEPVGELERQFTMAGLNNEYPFNSGEADYMNEANQMACYRNPARVQWVRGRIADMEEA